MKSIFKKLSLAIKSRVEIKNNLVEAQKDRLKICENCPFNSDNVKQLTLIDTFKIRLNKVLNFIVGVYVDNDSICTICGCNLIFKSTQKDPENMCPKGFWKD